MPKVQKKRVPKAVPKVYFEQLGVQRGCGYCPELSTTFFSHNEDARPDICVSCFLTAEGFEPVEVKRG